MKDKVRKLIAAKADALAEEHGIKDRERVEAILAQTLVKKGAVPENVNQLEFDPSLEEGCQYLAPKEALRLFESVDVSALRRKCRNVEYLADSATPFYTLEELADVAEEFRRHLERNRDFLLRTGFPKTTFKRSKWFDYFLSGLNFVKLPMCLKANRLAAARQVGERDGLAERDHEEDVIYTYSWAEECPLAARLPQRNETPLLEDTRGSTLPPAPHRLCAYEDASLIHGLPLRIARRLEKGREKYFRVKTHILSRLVDYALSSSKHKDVWAESLEILTRTYSQEEIAFYLHVDVQLRELGVADHLASLYRWNSIKGLGGGIPDLIYVIHHFEKQMVLGTFNKTKLAILDLVSDLGNMRSYFQIVGKPYQSTFDKALEDFEKLERRETRFWRNFGRRVGRDLVREFDAKVTFTFAPQYKYAEEFADLVESFGDWQDSHRRQTGRFAYMEMSMQPGKAPLVLSAEQEKDYERFDYKCRDQVRIPGTVPMRRSNLIVVNDHPIGIADKLFILLLYLVLELKKKKGGWVDIQTLKEERIVNDPDDYRIYSNLRRRLEGSLLNKNGQDFIENDGSRRYRISTHPDFITYDKKKLLNHPDYRVKRVAGKLPRR